MNYGRESTVVLQDDCVAYVLEKSSWRTTVRGEVVRNISDQHVTPKACEGGRPADQKTRDQMTNDQKTHFLRGAGFKVLQYTWVDKFHATGHLAT